MSFPTFWKSVGLGLAKAGVLAGKGALWASQHPEVISTVASIAGHPEIGVTIHAVDQMVIAAVTPKEKP